MNHPGRGKTTSLAHLNLRYPALPQTFLRIMELLQGGATSDVGAVCDAIQHDPGAVARVLRIATEKLVHNALKAMPDGGTLTIRSRLMGSEVTIEIADSGTGIPHFARADFLKRPIQRPPDSTAGGSGMGAHMARIVARRHQGELELVETSEGGTTLRLSFPVANGGVQ